MTEFIQRPIWMTDYAPGFLIPGKRGRKMAKTDALISLPMYAKYAKLRLDQIPMIRLLIDMHEPSNKTHVKFLKDAMQTLLDNEGLKDQYTTFAYQDVLDNSSKAMHTLEMIFNVVISITMFICFFSLSSSMTGNLYEQVKEISVMRSIGFPKGVIMKLFVYEAFILVVSASFSGVVIGTLVGWGMTLLRSMFVGMPTPLTFPQNEFVFILTTSIICAFLSTYSPSKALMAKSIPDIARST